jgi:hypothetical protein
MTAKPPKASAPSPTDKYVIADGMHCTINRNSNPKTKLVSRPSFIAS